MFTLHDTNSTPSPGITPNFVDPQTLAPTILAVSVVMTTWALLFVIIRLYANFHALRGLGIDDYFCLIATVLAITFSGILISLKKYARHWYDIPPAWFDEHYLKVSFAGDLIVVLTLFFAKSTIFLIYLRLFGIDKKTKYGAWFGLLWTSLIYLTGIPIELCSVPVMRRGWDVEAVDKYYGIIAIYSIVQGVLSVVLDLYIFLLPIPVILRIQMSQKKRLWVLGVFGTAVLGILAAIIGVIYRVKLIDTHDSFFASAIVYLCFTCETCVAIVVGSTPAFASFFKGKMPGASWQAGMAPFVRRFRHGASTSNTELLHASKKGVFPSGGFTTPGGHTRDRGYLEVHDIRYFGDSDTESTRTEIWEEGTASRILEESVVLQPVATHQSKMQEPSVVDGWANESPGAKIQ